MVKRLTSPAEPLWLEPKFFAAGLFWVLLGAVLFCRLVWRMSGRGKARLLLICAVAAVITLCLRHPFLTSLPTVVLPMRSAERNLRNETAERSEAHGVVRFVVMTWTDS
jgi:hypothetical protein